MTNYKRFGKIVIAVLIVVNVFLVLRSSRLWKKSSKFDFGRVFSQTNSANNFQQDSNSNLGNNVPSSSNQAGNINPNSGIDVPKDTQQQISNPPGDPEPPTNSLQVTNTANTNTNSASNNDAASVDILKNFGNSRIMENPTDQTLKSVSQQITMGEAEKPTARTGDEGSSSTLKGGMPDDLEVIGAEDTEELPRNQAVDDLVEEGSKENPNNDHMLLRADRILAQFGKNAEMGFTLHRYHGGYRIPSAIIIGAARCGTNQLAAFLALHQNIYLADGQINFFNNKSNYAKGLEWYGTKMPKDVPTDGVILERSPGYFYSDDAPKRIQAMSASTKLILMIRNPVRRTISEYAQYVAKARLNGQPVPSFEKLMVEPRSRLINTENLAVLRSIYHTHLHKWYKYFSKDQILILNGDAFIKNPFPELKKVEEFLGLSHLITEDKLYFNSTSGHFCAKKNGKPLCYNHISTWRNPDIDPNVLEKLTLFYKHHNAKLFSIMDDRLEW